MHRILTQHRESLLHLAGAILLGFFFLFLACSDQYKRQALWEQQLSNQSELQSLAVEQSQQALRRQALMVAQGLAQDPETLQLIRSISAIVARDGLESPDILPLRSQLARKLTGPWSLLQAAGANQLHIHLSPGVVSLLRMHQPSTWGDPLASIRPMVDRAQREGILVSGMETGRHGSGMRGIVPIRTNSLSSSPVIATLEVGFGMLPELQQLDSDLQSGLALLLNQDKLRDVVWDERVAGLTSVGDSGWWLDQYSRPEISTWLRDGALGRMVESWEPEVLEIDRRQFLLSHIPVINGQSGVELEDEAMAMILVWRDISALWEQYQSERRQAMLSWLGAFVAALTLLGCLMLASRESVRRQEKRQQDSLRDTVRRREQDQALLHIVAQAQSAYISASNLSESFDQLLDQILRLTRSRFGFVGQVLRDEEQKPYLQTYAISNIAWDAPSAELFQQRLEKGMIFNRLDTLFGQVLQHAEPYISNDPANDPHSGGLPPGHPALETFIGLPILFGDQLVGMIGLANRPKGYSHEDEDFLKPLLSTLGQLIHALVKDREERHIRMRLEQQRQALRALNEIAALPGLDTVSRLKKALELGCTYLQMDFGIISHIEEDQYLILAQHCPDNELQEGQRFDLGSTYCALTLQHNDVLPIEFMGQSKFSGHPCYELFKLERYLGVALTVNNQRYGTLNFSAGEPRDTPYDETDLEFLRLMGRWVSGTLSRWGMQQERSQLLARFGKLAQHLPGVVYQYQQTPDGRSWFPYTSEGLKDIYGVTPAAARKDASQIFEAIHPEDREQINQSIQASANTLSVWRGEYRVAHPTLGELWLSGNATPERLENGDLVWHGFITDITARKHMELTLERERSRLASIILGTNAGTWEWNLQTGETLVNERWAGIVGYRLEELLPLSATTWHKLFHPDDLALSTALFKSHLHGDLDYYECDARMRHKNGYWVWIKSRGRLISRDDDGKPLWISGTHTDITEQVETNQALKKSELRFRGMVSNLPGAVYRCTNDDKWTMSYLSDEISRITGYPATDFVDSKVRSYASIIHPDDLHLTYKAVEQINQQRVFELSYRVIHAQGHDVWVKEKGRGEFDRAGNLQWLSGFIWDATEQHRIDQMKNQFVSTVSHELRTPITAIAGSLGLLKGGALGPLPDSVANLVAVAHNNSQRLNSLINDLLDMDKLSAGKMSLRLLEQPLIPIVQQTLRDNQSYAEQYQVTLTTGQLDNVCINTDAQRLGQVLTNFMSNAAKFSRPGSQVVVDAVLQAGQVRISVTDTGKGIPASFHPTLFEKFSQVDATDTRQHNGTGLGLAISKELTERMGGEVGFESAPGEGSTFWCMFKVTEPES